MSKEKRSLKERFASLLRVNDEEQQDIHYEGNPMKRLLKYMKPYRRIFVICLVLVLALTGLELVKPIIIGDAIDRYITGEKSEVLLAEGREQWEAGEQAEERYSGVLKAGALYLGVLLLLFAFTRIQTLMLQKMGQDIIYDIRNELFTHVEKLIMRFFDTTPVGKIVTRLTNDVEAINEVFSNILVKLFRNVVKMIGLAVIMIAMNPRMALYSFVLVPVVAVMTLVFRLISRRTYRLMRTRLAALNTFLSEHLSGMKIIRVFGREERKYREFEEKNDSLYKASFREMMVFAVFRPGIILLSVIALMIIMVTGGAEVLGGTITIGTLYIFLQYINSFYQPIQELAEQFTSLQSAISASEKIFTLLDTKPAIAEEDHPVILPEIRGKITFDHVWFSYSGKEDDWVLKDVSFTIEPGQSVAFVGATGAGKAPS